MFLVTIGATNYAEDIVNTINTHIEALKKENFDIFKENYNVGNTTFLKCGLKENLLTRLTDKKQFEDFKFQIAKSLTETIICFWEPKLIKRILKENYFYLNDKEKESVYSIAIKLLQEEKPVLPGGFYRITRRNKIMRCIIEYLNAEEILNIDGFVNFRLGVYLKELNEAVERAIELYVAEKEYNEFIKLLKYFVDIQECKIDEIHLRQSSDGGYILLDENKNNVNGEFFDELGSEILDEKMNYDDLLISTLITISPRKIYLHDAENFKNKELVRTIKNVFSERITICTDCELCREGKAMIDKRETNNYSL